jgi:hypothetical protein
MSTTTTIEAPQLSYVQVPETSENLDWADLRTLDLSKFDQPGGKEELAAELTQAIEDVGALHLPSPFLPYLR